MTHPLIPYTIGFVCGSIATLCALGALAYSMGLIGGETDTPPKLVVLKDGTVAKSGSAPNV
jgi:hypothetical protein